MKRTACCTTSSSGAPRGRSRTSASIATSDANLVGADGGAKPEKAAEITASAFRIAPERPLLGRVLDESDERAGAPPVVLLGYDVWADALRSRPEDRRTHRADRDTASRRSSV